MKSYSTLRNLFGTLTVNTATANLTLGDQLINDAQRYLIQRFYDDERTTTATTTAGTQNYLLPFNYKDLNAVTITTGSYIYPVQECTTREQWDKLNMVTFQSDIPEFYFIFNKQIYFYPTPATTSNTITYYYKIRARDLSQADYTTGTVSATNSSTTITGSGTTWTANMAGRWIRLAMATSNSGDNEWYEISSVTNATTLVLTKAYNGATVSGATYTIGEMPILQEDFHDLIVYRAVMIYYSSRVKDVDKYQLYKGMYEDGLKAMEAMLGSKNTSVNASKGRSRMTNPNLLLRY